MKHLVVYWRTGPQDLNVLSAVDHVRLGIDEEDVITSDKGAEVIRGMAIEFNDAFYIDSTEEVDPRGAADLILHGFPREELQAPLQHLVDILGHEDAKAASTLAEEYDDLLHP